MQDEEEEEDDDDGTEGPPSSSSSSSSAPGGDGDAQDDEDAEVDEDEDKEAEEILDLEGVDASGGADLRPGASLTSGEELDGIGMSAKGKRGKKRGAKPAEPVDPEAEARVKEAVKLAIEELRAVDELRLRSMDEVRLGEPGWKERYYRCKFGAAGAQGGDLRKLICRKYVEGLQWVYGYYYRGVCSWDWYYPFHYAPFASDLNQVDQFKAVFSLGRPFLPMEQLMSVLPGRSAHCLPPACARLMRTKKSPIADFYPLDFPEDPNGQRYQWQWVALLPFIDETRLLEQVRKLEGTFTNEEKRRNSLGLDLVVTRRSHPLARTIGNKLIVTIENAGDAEPYKGAAHSKGSAPGGGDGGDYDAARVGHGGNGSSSGSAREVVPYSPIDA